MVECLAMVVLDIYVHLFYTNLTSVSKLLMAVEAHGCKTKETKLSIVVLNQLYVRHVAMG